MKFNIPFISISMLFCLTAQIFAPAGIASAEGCGVNPLGDTSGDTDFYVSKNQNLLAAGGSATSASGGANATAPLGSSADRIRENATIKRLNPDKVGPQEAGSTIIWTVEATNSSDEEMVYDFFLKGSATNYELIEKTGWIAENRWTWNTTDLDVGENQVQVHVKRLGAGEAESINVQNYTISAASSNELVEIISKSEPASAEMNPHPGQKTANIVVGKKAAAANNGPEDGSMGESASTDGAASAASSEMNPHPRQKTADIDVSKPRVAPDEKKSVAAATSGGLVDGPNMSMPDSSQVSSYENASTSMAAGGSAGIKPKIMDVGGKWTVDLIGSGCTLDVNLIQTGESIVGLGDLNDRNTNIPQTFKGKATTNSLKLKSKVVLGEYVNDIDRSVSLSLTEVDRTISGSYELYSGDELVGKGNATASRFSR